jgi:outer membrane protein assembly factor BamB
MIELDMSRPWDADDRLGLDERRPTHGWRNPPPWLVPILLAVVIAALLGGAAAPPRRDPLFAHRIPSAGLAFGPDDTAFVFQQRARSGRLQAYRLDRQGPLWTVDYSGATPVPTVTTDPELVMVSVYDADPGRGSQTLIEARESRTGRRLWQRSGVGIIDTSGGLLLVTDYRGWGGGGDLDLARPGTVEAVDLRTGTVRWSHAIAHTTLLAVMRAQPPGRHGDAWAGADGLAELDRDGVLRSLDPSTGTARHTVRLPLSGPALNLEIHDGVAVVSEAQNDDDPAGQDRAPTSVAGYDLETGEARWQADAPGFATPCGDRYLCAYGAQALIVTEPETGDVRYDGQFEQVNFRGDLMVVSRPVPITGGVASGSELWDLTTGRKLRSLGRWYIASSDPRDGDLVAQSGLGGVLIVATLDLETGAARVIGRARDWVGYASCTFGRRHLGCTGPDGVRIWRVPDGIGPLP